MSTIYSNIKNLKKEQTVILIDNLGSFLNTMNDLMKNNDYIFRGISKNDEKYPKIIRNNKVYSENRENQLFMEFEKYCGLYGRVRDCWEFLALAQHHGLETRLIDFSSNPFVATFFSLHNSSATKHIIYVANKKDYEEIKKVNFSCNGETFFGNISEMSYAQRTEYNFTRLSIEGKTIILEPNYANERVFAQRGLFLIPPFVDTKNIDTIYDEMPIKLVIDKSASEEILAYLNKNNFDEFHLMPDLSSACFEINLITK